MAIVKKDSLEFQFDNYQYGSRFMTGYFVHEYNSIGVVLHIALPVGKIKAENNQNVKTSN